MATASVSRVTRNTSPEVNDRIREEMENRILSYSNRGPEVIRQRLDELDREWDIERVIETEAPLVALTGLTLGMAANRKWLALPGLVGSMVFLHALQGWYPLLPLLRRMGIRTREEIGEEKMALKALRGDFADVSDESSDISRAEAALRAVRR